MGVYGKIGNINAISRVTRNMSGTNSNVKHKLSVRFIDFASIVTITRKYGKLNFRPHVMQITYIRLQERCPGSKNKLSM